MLGSIRSFFETNVLSAAGAKSAADRSLQLAAASLLIEVSRADFHIDDSERRAITNGVQTLFGLSDHETQEIIALAEKEAEQATCMYEFTSLVNEHFTHEQKLKIIELMWRVSFADNDKDKYEEHFIRKIADLIYVSPAEFVRLREQAKP